MNYGGLVLSTTIDKYIYCIVKERKFDDKIIVNYSIKETVDSVSDLKHDLVREALRIMGITKGIEISFLSDIPTQGSGLGSSSSVTIGVLNALHHYLGYPASNEQLIDEAIQIELDILGKHIGVQDQCAIAFGGMNVIELKDEFVSVHVGMDESVKEDFNNSLMLFYTGITRKSDEVLSTFDVEENLQLLHKNKQMANSGFLALQKGDLTKFGQLLDEYWETKKRLNDKVSNQEVDKMYEMAKKAGAIGGKVIGAGGGGFLLVMFPANKRAIIRKALSEYKELPFRFTDSGSKVIVNI
jgi:D-glycero-alpha-D-manno-heptose-7-phosphate kinase